jgi:hypothetical protein
VSGLSGASGPFDEFGIALAAGDFDGDERADLAIGDSNDDAGADGAGAVSAVYGSKRGLKARGSGLLAQGLAGMAGASGDGDEFGIDVAAGDFDGDARADVAIGDSNDDAGADGAGAVSAVYGSKKGLKAKGNQFLAQGLAGILGVSEASESFGDELAG